MCLNVCLKVGFRYLFLSLIHCIGLSVMSHSLCFYLALSLSLFVSYSVPASATVIKLKLYIFKDKEPETVKEDQQTAEASEPNPEEESGLVGDSEVVAEDQENGTTKSVESDEEKPTIQGI